jgi:hypothetical protein
MMLHLAFLLSTALTAALLAFFAFWQRYLQKSKIASSTDSSFAPYTSATYPILGTLSSHGDHVSTEGWCFEYDVAFSSHLGNNMITDFGIRSAPHILIYVGSKPI